MVDFFWQSFVIFAVTVDPIGLVPLFLAATLNYADTQRSQIAFRATLIATGILVAFAVGGEKFLNILGIGFPALRIAGGILLFLVAIDMLLVRESGLRSAVHHLGYCSTRKMRAVMPAPHHLHGMQPLS